MLVDGWLDEDKLATGYSADAGSSMASGRPRCFYLPRALLMRQAPKAANGYVMLASELPVQTGIPQPLRLLDGHQSG